jgi:hypothetical protein
MSAPLHFAILRCASILVPADDRSEWLAEWQAELWYLRGRALRFCLGAFRDAFWLRRNAPHPEKGRLFSPKSALRCILWLAALAAASVFFAVRQYGDTSLGTPGSPAREYPVLTRLAITLLALVIVRISTPLDLGEYPRITNLRRWLFLAIKIGLLIPIVFCGTLDLTWLISASQIQPLGLLFGCILAFRWALKDQRQRCPVCLNVLTHPALIGMASQTFLEWYGTELICEKGHGLLHVPEIPNSCYSTQRWTYLDPSWRVLF